MQRIRERTTLEGSVSAQSIKATRCVFLLLIYSMKAIMAAAHTYMAHTYAHIIHYLICQMSVCDKQRNKPATTKTPNANAKQTHTHIHGYVNTCICIYPEIVFLHLHEK